MVLVRNAGCSPACASTKRNAVFQIEYWLALLVIASFRGWPATNTCPSYWWARQVKEQTRKPRTSTKNKNNNNEHTEEGITTHPNNNNNLENKEHNQEQGKHNFEQHRTNTNTTILKTTEPKRRPGSRTKDNFKHKEQYHGTKNNNIKNDQITNQKRNTLSKTKNQFKNKKHIPNIRTENKQQKQRTFNKHTIPKNKNNTKDQIPIKNKE